MQDFSSFMGQTDASPEDGAGNSSAAMPSGLDHLGGVLGGPAALFGLPGDMLVDQVIIQLLAESSSMIGMSCMHGHSFT